MTKNNLFKAFALLAVGVMLFACKPPVEPALSVSDKAVNFASDANLDKVITVTSNQAWTVTCDADWLTIEPKSGEGDGTFKITAKANSAFTERTVDVKVASATLSEVVKVTQVANTPSLSLVPTEIEFTSEGGEESFAITSNADWSVSVPENDWLTVSPVSGNGAGTVTVTAAAYNGLEPRNVELTVTAEGLSQKVAVSQTGITPSISLDGLASIVTTGAGSTTQVKVVSNVTWEVVIPEECDWISVSSASNEGEAETALTVAQNLTLKERSAVVTFRETVTNQEVSLAVEQGAGEPSRYSDSLALVAIYNAAKGAEWAEAFRWDLTKPISEWRNVTLDEEGRVSKLQVVKNAAVPEEWNLPEDVKDLSALIDLRVNTAKLGGAFPEFLYGMTQLTQLWLTGNNLTGSISPKLGQFVNMTHLYIDQNPNLSGELPKEIGNMVKLQNINISQTKIGGTIPEELRNCADLANFMAFKTQLATPIPDIWDSFPKIGVIQLYGNPNMTGNFPDVFVKVNVSKNYSLWLYECNFEGNIPESYGSATTYLNQFRLNGNKMSGVVPAAVQAHPKWSTWTPAKYILPQQDGYGLTLE